MLPKQNRLSKNDVEFLLKKGVKHKSDNFLVIIRRNTSGLNRFCIIISKKLKLKSTQRTQTRRRIYEAVRKNLGVAYPTGTATVNATYDIALCPSHKIITKKFSDIEQEIIKILKTWVKTS